ncbi:MAG: hypothetical protein HY672_04925 [Chloroflexi bacterium]|nr:hypothetical protein [Chloroflexota bacterium]
MLSIERWNKLRHGLPRVRTWVLLAALLEAVVVLYWAYLGARYVISAGEVSRLKEDVAIVMESLSTPAASQTSPGQTEAADQRFKDLATRFNRYDSETLVGMVYEVADASGVGITALVMGKASAKVEDGVQYQLQPLTLNLNGGTYNVISFLEGLRQQIPALAVADTRLSGSDGQPTAQMQLVLYVSPQPAPKQPATGK